MKRPRITTALLVILNLGLAVSAGVLWKTGQRQVREPVNMVVTPPPSLDLSVLNSVPVPSVEVASIRDQAAMYASRSFYQPPPVPVSVTPPEYELAGTMRLADGKHIAFATRKSDHGTRTLHLGDDLDGWQVAAIEPDRVNLAHEQQFAELRPASAGAGQGLMRGASAPAPPVTGIRVLGGGSSALTPMAARGAPGDARVYHPPAPLHK
jgi:hypothetical protein